MNGIIIINKPKGITSNDVVNKVKRILNEKVGHTGTLDPNATGVLPLLIGKGTKLSKYLINHDKTYIATLKLGEKRSTADVEGTVISTMEVPDNILRKEFVEDVLKSFIGKQIQTPPIYSAIKVKGKKLYEYARNNIDVEIPKREIEIYNITLEKIDIVSKEIKFMVECSKGTYIRSLCEDIAEKLGNVGYMSELTRKSAGEFDLENAISIEMLEQNKDNKAWIKENIITLEDLLVSSQSLELREDDLEKLLNGISINCDLTDGICKLYCNKKFIGSGNVKDKKVKRDVIL